MLIEPALQNHIETFNLELNESLISNKAPNLHSVSCSEMYIVSSTTKDYCKREGIVISSCFLWKLLLFYYKKISQLII